MGTCFSKKKGSSSSSSSSSSVAATAVSSAPLPDPTISITNKDDTQKSSNVENIELQMKPKKEKKTVREKQQQQQVEEDACGQVKKEIFVIKHRKSHDGRDRDSRSPPPQLQEPLAPNTSSSNELVAAAAAAAGELTSNKVTAATAVGVRTSSCTKEEVDAILIQCGRLSRSSSGKAASSSSCERGRKYSGSKRSYDFDRCDNEVVADVDDDKKKPNDYCEEDETEKRHHRQRHRQSSRPSSSSQGRRRTPSRERDQQQRSSSRERRVSRSPGRRSSETATPTTNANAATNANGNTTRPGKMVSVPATVSSLVMDKSNNGGGESAIKRISVKRNAGSEAGSRGAASPRSQSPARANANAKVSNENQQQPSLSRSSSRKAEQSPYRRNPLSEIDPNSLAYPQPPYNNNSSSSRVQHKNKKEIEGEGVIVKESTNLLNQKPNVETKNSNKRAFVQGNNNNKTSSRGTVDHQVVSENCTAKEHQQAIVDEGKEQSSMMGHVTVKTMVDSGIESLKSQTLTRSRSSRRSRDLDLNPETLLNPSNPSYTALLLKDIHNFHQKNMNTTAVSLPPCVTKACSILEAVADLNSTTSSNLSCAFSEDRKSPPTYQSNRNDYNFANLVGKRILDTKDPFVESEVAVSDDVMEPSFHKYVTVTRGGALGGGDMEDQESSGSNSFVASGQQHWCLSSSSWEPNSADSTDCWTSRLNTREEDQKSPLGFEGSLFSESGRNMDEVRKRLSAKKRDSDHHQNNEIGRGRLGSSSKSLHTVSAVAST